MSGKDRAYYVDRDFDAVDTPSGVRYEPRRPALRKLGEPPWTLEVDMFDGIIPDEASDLVGRIVWRGREFARVGLGGGADEG